jgi:hypothetical protein
MEASQSRTSIQLAVYQESAGDDPGEFVQRKWAWRQHMEAAERHCGYAEAEARYEVMSDEMHGLYCEISALTATTLRGLVAKTRFADDSDRVRDSIVRDLLAMASA